MKDKKVYFVKFPNFEDFALKYRIATLLTFFFAILIMLYKGVSSLTPIELFEIIVIFTYALLWMREKMFKSLVQQLERVFKENIELFQNEKNKTYLVEKYTIFEEYRKLNRKITYSFFIGVLLFLIVYILFIPLGSKQLQNLYSFLLRIFIVVYFTLFLYKDLYSIFNYFKDITALYVEKKYLMEDKGIEFSELPSWNFYVLSWKKTLNICMFISIIGFILYLLNILPIYGIYSLFYICCLILLLKMTIELNSIVKTSLQFLKLYDSSLKELYSAELHTETNDLRTQLSSEMGKSIKDFFK